VEINTLSLFSPLSRLTAERVSVMDGTRAPESSRFRCSGKAGNSALPPHWDVPFANRSANRSIGGRKSGY
jgi:hypothetical protein